MNMQKNLFAAAMTLATLTVASCGGGGSSSPTTTTVQGKVIDGYIANATICLDINKNARCDEGEPSTTSDASGAYSLSFAGTADDKVILARASDFSIDSDDGGITINEAGRTAFTLAAPAINASVISPLTTLVTLELVTNLSAPITPERIAAAEKSVQKSLDDTTPIMGYDFVKASNTNVQNLAKVITAVLPESFVEAKTTLLAAASQEISDSQALQQIIYQGTQAGVYAVLGMVIDNNSNHTLKYPLDKAMTNAVKGARILGVSGSGTKATLTLQPYSSSYYNDNVPTYFTEACPANTSDLQCFIFQEFEQ